MPPPAILDESRGLRPAMNWLHTWFGVVVGALLFIIFWTGTLSVFDREIDRWTMPMSRIEPKPLMDLDALPGVMAAAYPDAAGWTLDLPTARTPALETYVRAPDGSYIWEFQDPATGENYGEPETKGGAGFFYRYHFTLHLNLFNIGLMICAMAALVMMALCISGVIIHKKLFTDFFTLRAGSKSQRMTLDVHNLSGVLALPFHFIISFSGIALFGMMYAPAAQSVIFKGNPEETNTGYYSRAASGEPGGEIASLVPMFETARAAWNGDEPKRIRLHHQGDANAYLELKRSSKHRLAHRYDSIWFDAASGNMLMKTENTVSTEVYHTIAGLHLVQFRHLLLRWLYFISGLAGCVLIATGFIFWVESRRKKYARNGMAGIRLVEGLAAGSVTGALIASLAFMIANRLLPLGVAGRDAIEVWAFHIVWIAAFAHAFFRSESAWREQCWTIAAGCVIAVALNGLTTGDWPPVAIARSQLGVAGVDLFMLTCAAAAVYAAVKLSPLTGDALNRTQRGPEKTA